MEKILFSKDINKILDKLDFSKLGNNIAIKLHFGEKGCDTYISPELTKKVYEKITSLGKKATLIETNVLYRGARTTTKEHLKTAEEHGFDFAPIDILDGEKGEQYIEVKLEKGNAKNIKLGKNIKNYDSMIVLTHFKGHMIGYGGAFKNIGMGLGSRSGKLHMHSEISPLINKDKCIGCETCIKNCDFNAISIKNKKAEINNKKCAGCAMCIAVCPQEAVLVPWEGSAVKDVQEKIIDYCESVFKIIPQEKMIFINVLQNITPECDCMEFKQTPITPDIGILAGYNIVAIDKASLDLANKFSNGKFDKINSFDKYHQVDYAFEKGLGNKEYEIIEI